MSRSHERRLSKLEGVNTAENVTVVVIRRFTNPDTGEWSREPTEPSDDQISEARLLASSRGRACATFINDKLINPENL